MPDRTAFRIDSLNKFIVFKIRARNSTAERLYLASLPLVDNNAFLRIPGPARHQINFALVNVPLAALTGVHENTK